MAVRWNGVLIESPNFPRRTAWDDINAALERTAVPMAALSVILGSLAGRLVAPVLGY